MSLSPCHLTSGVTPPCRAALPVNFILARQETAVTLSSDSARPPLYYFDGDMLKMCHQSDTGCQSRRVRKAAGAIKFMKKIKFEA